MGLLALCQSYCHTSMPFELSPLCKFSPHPFLLSNLSGCKYPCTLTSSSLCSSTGRLHNSLTDLTPEPSCTKMRASFTTWSVPAPLQPSPALRTCSVSWKASVLQVRAGNRQGCEIDSTIFFCAINLRVQAVNSLPLSQEGNPF